MKVLVTKLSLVCVSLIVISLMFTSIGNAKIDPKTIVGAWLFNEGSGNTAKDSSGKSNHGKLMNNPKWVKGKFGQALEFDGADDCVDCGNDSSLAPGSGSYSVEAWFKTSDAKHQDIFNHGDTNDQQFLELNDGKLRAIICDIDNDFVQIITPTTGEFDDGLWHHVAMVYTASTHTLELFADSVSKGTDTNKNVGSMTPTANLQIGMMNNARYFKGLIDEVVIFNVALTEADIKSMTKGYVSALAVSPAGKLATTWAHIKSK